MLLFNLVHRICSSYWPVVWWGSIDWQRLDYQRVLATPSLQYSGWSGSPCAHTPSSSTPVISSTHVLQERTWRLTSSQHTNNVLQGKCILPCLKFLSYWAWQFELVTVWHLVMFFSLLHVVIGCSVTLSDCVTIPFFTCQCNKIWSVHNFKNPEEPCVFRSVLIVHVYVSSYSLHLHLKMCSFFSFF